MEGSRDEPRRPVMASKGKGNPFGGKKSMAGGKKMGRGC